PPGAATTARGWASMAWSAGTLSGPPPAIVPMKGPWTARSGTDEETITRERTPSRSMAHSCDAMGGRQFLYTAGGGRLQRKYLVMKAPSHEIASVQGGEPRGLPLGEAELAQAAAAAAIHLLLQRHHAGVTGRDRVRLPRTGSNQHERVEHLLVQPGGVAQR